MTTLVPSSPYANEGPGFNHAAAEQVYETILGLDDDAAQVYADMVVGAVFAHDQDRYHDAIVGEVRKQLARRGEAAREALVRSYVSKRAAGQDVDAVIGAAQEFGEIAKDFDQFNFSPQDRARRAHAQQKDLQSGRFVKTNHVIQYGADEHGRPLQPADDRQAERMGIPAPTAKISDVQRSRYQQAYAQVRGLVHGHLHELPKEPGEPVRAFLHLRYGGDLDDVISPLHPTPEVDPTRTVLSASVSVLPDTAGDSNAYEALNALSGQYGDPDRAAGHLRTLNRELDEHDPFTAGSGLFGRLKASSNFLDRSFQDDDGKSVLPARAQAAIRAGQVIGTAGPEASKILSPVGDKAAYRYRGTERTAPDRRLTTAVESIRRDPRVPPEQKRELMVHGQDVDSGWQPSGVLNYFRGLLPSADLNTLQVSSGRVPPSQGVILDPDGKIATQAVGFGEDHYLPFNLKGGKMGKLKGGEYIRTRTWGGPTTEDIYTGLITGAHSLTVVSHNGVYNVEFDPSFKGGRRYNDKAARMVSRYGYLLDAVKSGQVTTGGIDPTRIAEIEADAEGSYDRDSQPEEWKAEKNRLMLAEQRNPRFSAEQKAAAAQGFLDEVAINHRTPDGHEMTRDELVDDWLTHQASAAMRAAREDPEGANRGLGAIIAGGRSGVGEHTRVAPADTLGTVKARIAAQAGLTDPDPVRFAEASVTAMGLGDRYQRYTERAEQTYKAGLRPLALNGKGYELALSALAEQFPYYINRVSFRPWIDAKHGKDTGYVKPKHNRPADVLAGYFDSSINGQSKVHADSIRGQGRWAAGEGESGGGRTLRRYVSPQEKARAAAATGSTGSTGAVGRGGKLNASDTAALRGTADRAMIEHLKTFTSFNPTMAVPNEARFNGAAGDRPVEAHLDDLRTINPALVRLREMTPSRLDVELSTPAGAAGLHEDVVAAVDKIESHKMFRLDPAALKAFRAEGRTPSAGRFDKSDPNAALGSLDDDHDFGGAKGYQPGAKTADAEAAYTGLKTAAAKLGLPDTVGADDFTAKASEARTALTARNTKRITQLKTTGWAPPAATRELSSDIETLARATQLRRRWDAAHAEEDEAAAAAATLQTGQPVFHVNIAPPFGLAGGTTVGTGASPAAKLTRAPQHDLSSYHPDADFQLSPEDQAELDGLGFGPRR